MLLETSLFFKTMLILCGQLTVVLGTCFYCIREAKRAYENNTSFAGMHFRGSMNMNKQLDLVPYTAAPEHYPSEMCKQIPSEKNPNKSETKTVMAMNEAHRLDLLKDGYIDSEGGEFFYFAFILWVCPTISFKVLKPRLAMICLSSSATKYMKLITCSGVPLKFLRSSGSCVAIPTGQVFK